TRKWPMIQPSLLRRPVPDRVCLGHETLGVRSSRTLLRRRFWVIVRTTFRASSVLVGFEGSRIRRSWIWQSSRIRFWRFSVPTNSTVLGPTASRLGAQLSGLGTRGLGDLGTRRLGTQRLSVAGFRDHFRDQGFGIQRERIHLLANNRS